MKCDHIFRSGPLFEGHIFVGASMGQCPKEALEGFKLGRYRVLVATDIASRGIDVKSIELVINFDLPENPEDYVHRIGRTGRAGLSGKAISFAMPDQGPKVREIERLTRIYLPISGLPDISKHLGSPGNNFDSPRNNYSPYRGGARKRFSRKRF